MHKIYLHTHIKYVQVQHTPTVRSTSLSLMNISHNLTYTESTFAISSER